MKDLQLRIIKKIPQIVLPKEKNEMFIDWYNKDLRFLEEVPHTFERGYLFLKDTIFQEVLLEKSKLNEMLKTMARLYKITYRQAEDCYNEMVDKTKDTIIYFEFDNNWLKLDIYLNKTKNSHFEANLLVSDNSIPKPTVQDYLMLMFEKNKNFDDMYSYYCLVLLEASLWYIATTQKTTKYYRQEKVPSYISEKKEIFNVKKNKYITTPIYDMQKIKRVKTEGLIKKRKGWTYSHSFQVHGHYRHYANGKVIFIKSFTKGKGKTELSQIITLNPKE